MFAKVHSFRCDLFSFGALFIQLNINRIFRWCLCTLCSLHSYRLNQGAYLWPDDVQKLWEVLVCKFRVEIGATIRWAVLNTSVNKANIVLANSTDGWILERLAERVDGTDALLNAIALLLFSLLSSCIFHDHLYCSHIMELSCGTRSEWNGITATNIMLTFFPNQTYRLLYGTNNSNSRRMCVCVCVWERG